MKYIILTLIVLAFFTSCNLVEKDSIERYDKSFFKHDSKKFITMFKLEFSNSISSNKEKVETSRPLIINDEVLILGALNYFYKVNYQKGYVLSKKKLPFSLFGNINLVGEDKIIFYASDGYIYLTDIDLNKVYWKYKLVDESVVGDYKIVGNSLIFKTSQDRIYSLNKDNAGLNWVTKSYISDYMPLSSEAGILVKDGKIFSGFSNGKVSTFDISSGKTLYEESMTTEESFNDITASIVIDGETAFIPSYKTGIVSIDLKTKTKNWTSKIPAISQLFIFGEVGIYFSSDEMIKISMKSGKILKKHKLSIANPNNYFLYKDKYIVISSKETGIYLIDVNNLERSSKIGISSGISVKPILRENKLIILTNNSNLYVLKVK